MEVFNMSKSPSNCFWEFPCVVEYNLRKLSQYSTIAFNSHPATILMKKSLQIMSVSLIKWVI